ncbi:MAG TPA: ABC transporter permease subunit [Tepidisphaeraceae bacterium]|jgi:ABC-type transport system involved in multi-copper enzyme maturation permease subunit|nr:ABC transporter permease subunit [Tepidisphaeraceae bacterium]
MYRTWVIIRHTFLEAIVQPIYPLLLGLGGVILIIYGLLPFFTLGEDTQMYMAVGLDVTLLIALLATLFAASRSIYEEIEDRTMLTLMSKPLYKAEVLVGKYLGIVLAAFLAVLALGAIMALCIYNRIPTDYQLRTWTLNPQDALTIFSYRYMHLSGLWPSLLLVWFEVSVLAAIAVALSTRFSLVVNLPTVILIYIAGNLTRFLFPMDEHTSLPVRALAYGVAGILPYLESFDLRGLTVYHTIALNGTIFADARNGVHMGSIVQYLGIAAGYGIAYAVFALSIGMWLFQTRELGGAEG